MYVFTMLEIHMFKHSTVYQNKICMTVLLICHIVHRLVYKQDLNTLNSYCNINAFFAFVLFMVFI